MTVIKNLAIRFSKCQWKRRLFGCLDLIIIIMIMIRFVARTYPPCWVLKARIQKHRGKPLLFHDTCPGFFYVHYTTHGTYSFTSHPKDEAIMETSAATGQAGIRTHILATPELESNALDRSATTLSFIDKNKLLMARNVFGFLAKNKPIWVSGKSKNIPGANWLSILWPVPVANFC